MTTELNFDYDAMAPDEALPDSDMRRNLIPIESAVDGGVIAWAVDDVHAMAIVRALNAAKGEYEAEIVSAEARGDYPFGSLQLD